MKSNKEVNVFFETVQNNGIIYLRLVQSVRVTNKNGLKVSAKKVLLNICPLNNYDDGKPDYVNRLKKSFKEGRPLIPALSKFCPKDNRDLDHYSCSIKFCDNDSIGHPQNYSNTVIEYILEKIVSITDEVYTFNEVIDHIDLRKYCVKEENIKGRPQYDREKLLNVIIFAYMEDG